MCETGYIEKVSVLRYNEDIMLLSVKSLEKQYGAETVFSNISFTLDEGHKVALVGRNGAGKSTLMKIIAGETEPDSGTVTLTGDRTVAYLPQEVKQDDTRTGIEYVQDGTDLRPHQFFPVFEGLGISQETAKQKLIEMSGGQQTKILLTRFLLKPSDMLLLDEPTNNLDIPSLLWLESFLASSKKAMILISHDLIFLNTVANRVFELKNGSLTVERGTYSDYIERKKKEFARQMKEYNLYQEEVRRLRKAVTTAKGKGEEIDATEASDSDKMATDWQKDRASSKQRSARVLERRIKKLEVVEKPFEEDPFTLDLEAQNTDGDAEINAEDLIAGHTADTTAGPISFTLKMGERLCLMGMNGEGKSTLLKTIAGVLPPIDGSVHVSEGIFFGDLMQQHERADRNETVIDFFIQQTDSTTEKALHTLKRSGFTEQMIQQKIAGISSGMRARLLFAVFIVLGVNALILDEPTNHLDIEAVAALKEMLKRYNGIVLLVSHNRWFLEDLDITAYYAIENGKIERIADFDRYIAAVHKRAEKMTARLRRKIV